MTRVLLVEDNPGDAELVRMRLRDSRGPPLFLEWQESLEEGLAAYAEQAPDIVLLDLNLPDSNGLETLTTFRARIPAACIVVFTGTDDLETGLAAIRLGADDYLAKSEIVGDGFRRTLSYAVERRRMMASLEREREEKARLYQEAERAWQARDRLLQIVSHDLRNHVTTMQIGLRLLKISDASDDRMRRIESMDRASGTLLRLLQDLVDMAAIEKGVLHVEPRPEDALQLVDDAYEAFLPAMQRKAILFARRKPSVPTLVSADRDRVLQVLGNLLGNACKFTPAEGSVTLGCEPAEDGATFFVEDSGPGIAQEDRKRVFERFFRGSHASGHGAGLGLAIAKALIEAHGGTIWVAGDQGKGATFAFTLPSVPGPCTVNP